eukprot:7499975-Pyramimonas_sp.AAC.1
MVDAIATLVSLGSLPRPGRRWRACLSDLQALQWLWLRFEPLRIQQQYPPTGDECMPAFVETATDKASALFHLLRFSARDRAGAEVRESAGAPSSTTAYSR